MSKKFVKHYTRREFLSAAALSTLAFNFVPSRVWGANDRLRFAGIGVGGKGDGDISQAGRLGDVVALCDIDDHTLGKKAKEFPNARRFNDFREMLETMEREIDAVTVSTPDHCHAPAALMAMRLGKHVYCQKPLTHTVYEARLMRDTARANKVATQMGNQGTASRGFRRAIEVIQSGAIGPVREAHVWTNRPIWPQAPEVVARPTDTPPVPPQVHWDLWLGPAPWRPYSPAYHPFAWRGWWDFGTGALGDMACHTANMAFMSLKLSNPVRISAESGPVNPETYPGWASIVWEFPRRWDLDPVKLFWYEGKRDGKKNLPPEELFHGNKPPGSGSLLVGEKGILYSPNDYGAESRLLPAEDFRDYKPPTPWLPRNPEGSDLGMKEEWVHAIKGGPPAFSNFDYGSQITETILLGNVAVRLGKTIEWDADNLRSPNAPEAAKYLRTEYRPGWNPMA